MPPRSRWDANWTPPDRDFFPQGQGVISICRWTTEWQSLVDGSGHKDDEVRVESKGGATGVSADLTASPQGAPSVSCRTSISLPAPQVDANHASSSADTDQQTLSVNATDFSLSNDVPPKRSELIFFHVSFADGARSHTKTRRRKTRSMPEDASLVTPQHIKKSCDTDSERYDKLQADEWTAAVDIQRVLCRGCGGTTLLDQREGMRYYPGAWNKHRGRCRKIKSGKGLEGADHARAVYAFWNPQAGVEADNRTKRTARKSRVKPY
ncbi:hypothetical protein FB45DRAFT_932530 [Roridomyces roridus]|uniref:Uncharacterized protein n=1 Tax=Roridomyces roridus TaxID=1738132 RepID=A0AAD7BDH6_9AGAR|nr:hypothetical protein FB45DRAFT_932530 [Roridomyces roridus]